MNSPSYILLALAILAAPAAGQQIHFDFETGDLQGWQVVEGAFDYLVSDRARYHNPPPRPYNKQGKYYLSTVEQQPGKPSNDRFTGVVESPVFVLEGAEMTFLVGGGKYDGVYVALCTLDGKEHLKARGVQDEVMQRTTWKAPQLVGQRVFLRVVDRETQGWGHVTLDDFTAAGRIDGEATKRRFADVEVRRRREELVKALGEIDLPALRSAVEDLTRTFGNEYPKGPEYLRRIEAAEKALAELGKRGHSTFSGTQAGADEDADGKSRMSPFSVDKLAPLAAELKALSREALLANPLVRQHPILFTVRKPYRSSYHAIDTLFHTDEMNTRDFSGGGAFKILDVAAGTVRILLESADGLPRDPEVHFDAKRIVFAFRKNRGDDYHIHQMDLAGGRPRQLTFAPGVCDFDPTYLADDDILFSSTRERKYNQCSQDIAANLFRMEGDGANIEQIDQNNLFDNQSVLMEDGRVLYCRWEYVDRNFGDAHSLWTCNPDGTNHAIYWGNNTASPGAALAPRQIPGTNRVACIFGPHHFRLEGALAAIDPTLGLDGPEGVLHVWPSEWKARIRAGGPFDCDGFQGVPVKYTDPYPLARRQDNAGAGKYFLVARMTRPGGPFGIYLVDVFGNQTLLHFEEPGCYDPMPIAPRPRPPVLPVRRDWHSSTGTFYVQNVYEGTHMKGVEPGSVKRLRVVEAPEKRTYSHGRWFGQGYTAPGMNWHSLENKRILGSVPVESDGSAYFAVPAERFVYFQLLDENGMMIQSMRSATFLMPGEQAGCVGCHEDRLRSPLGPKPRPTLAMAKPPQRLDPWQGEVREFSYMAEVQPIFNKHCLGCHDFGKDGAKKVCLAPDRATTFNMAYKELWKKGYIRAVGAGPAEIQPARSWGARVSKLIQHLRKGHKDVKLSADEMDRLITWCDLNGVYYGTYHCAYRDSPTGRCPLTPQQLGLLGKLTGASFANSFNASPGAMVSFDRPELSPCLARLDKADPKYAQALAIIQAGKDMLASRPRADMPGFVPCDECLRREREFARRAALQQKVKEAIASGRRVYDIDH